jgi:hypothetical protein
MVIVLLRFWDIQDGVKALQDELNISWFESQNLFNSTC